MVNKLLAILALICVSLTLTSTQALAKKRTATSKKTLSSARKPSAGAPPKTAPNLRGTIQPTSPPTAATKDPEVERLLRYGAESHRRGELTLAEEIFRQALGKDPRNSDAYFNLGALAEGRGDYVAALGHYSAASLFNPGDAQIAEARAAMESAIRNTGPHSPLQIPSAANGSIANTQNSPASSEAVLLESQYSRSDPPVAQDGKVFQLRSNQDALLPPVLGVSPSQTVAPQIPVQPAAPINMPQSKSNRAARAVLGTALNIGASYALRGTGLHCPICRFVRLGF
ncbi:MAG: hypothetical protein K2Y32_12360 [Candidatus Obscuribacterales bacterium]|nr:hypothetical protein [Candidatus Obscuribacterales bacterium]